MNLKKIIPYLFLDILLINNKLEFKVYKKINYKNNFIYFYSNQSDKTKSGILIGFFSWEPLEYAPLIF